MRRIPNLFVLLMVCCFAVPVWADDDVRVFFGPASAETPNGVYAGLQEFIASAKQEISGSVHEIDMISIADALAKKSREGVQVQLVVESRWYEQPKSFAVRQILEKAGVKVFPDTKASGLMHNKFWVADNKRVWTGSTNLTSTCLFYNPNNAVWVENAQVAANYKTEFEEQQNGRFGKRGSGTPNTPYPLVTLQGMTIRTCFSPEDDALDQVVTQIKAAQHSVEIMCFVFSSEVITRALLDAKQRGVVVRVLLDDTFRSDAATARWRYVPSRELASAGIAVRWDNVRSKLHHKVVIVDSQVVVTGSMNLSANGANNNDENTLIISSAQVAKQFAGQFEKLWRESENPDEPDYSAEPEDNDDQD